MYHFIVRQRLRASFKRLNAGDFDFILKQFPPNIQHIFFGKHPLAGTRRGLPLNRLWYKRLAAVLPGVQFEIKNVLVNGWPWNTVAAVEWTDSGATKDGKPYHNQGVHFFRLKWGRLTSLRIYCDTQVLAEVCKRQAALGIEEAEAPPIEG